MNDLVWSMDIYETKRFFILFSTRFFKLVGAWDRRYGAM